MGTVPGKVASVSTSNTVDKSVSSTTKIPVAGVISSHRFATALSEIDKLKSDERIFSKESCVGTYETLFNEFELSAKPVYNFFVKDELYNDTQGIGQRKLDDVPRYILVQWNKSPQIRTFDASADQKSVTSKSTEPILFGSHISKKAAFDIDGMTFAPSHLQPGSFALIKRSLANDSLAPGVIRATLELDTDNVGSLAGFSSNGELSAFDEQAFLSDPSLKGVSMQEYRAHVYASLLGMNTTRESLDEVKSTEKEEFVEGKFNFTSGNGTSTIKSVHPSSPSISMNTNTSNAIQNSTDEIDQISKRVMVVGNGLDEKTVTTKINFVNPNIGGAISESKVNLATKSEHAENILALSQVISQLDILSKTDFYKKKEATMPSFKSPPGIPGLEYVGYVLEKYKKTPTGVFEKVEEIDLPNNDYETYVDAKVVYGAVYRYRIKGIIRWTHEVLDFSGGKRMDPTKKLESSYFSSEWNEKWAYAMCIDEMPPAWPDELQVRPESHARRVCITFKVPHNPQKDIIGMILYRKTLDSRGNDLSSWRPIKFTGGFGNVVFDPQNVLYHDHDVDFAQNNGGVWYVYTARSFSRHLEASHYSEQIACQLNSDFATYGEFTVKQISCAGVDPAHFGSFAVRPMKLNHSNVVVSEGDGSLTLPVTARESASGAALLNSEYVIRLESLDTGEFVDVPISMNYNNTPTVERSIATGFWIPGVSSLQDHEIVESRTRSTSGQVPVKVAQKAINTKTK